jgi:hypothetical protein
MAVGPVQSAKRALVGVLLALALAYRVTVVLSRESTDEQVAKAYRRVLLKTHPDKGGKTDDQQKLQETKEAWDTAKRDAGQRGRPPAPEDARRNDSGRAPSRKLSDARVMTPTGWVELADPEEARKKYRIQSVAVLLTYNGVADLAQWRRFVKHVQASLKCWRVKHWCATLEANKKDKLHIHLMLQFHSQVDRCSSFFAFENLKPRADPTDLLGEGFCKRRLQESIDRAMFYCWADKRGTKRDERGKECTVGNYEPCWTNATFTYAVKGKWPESLWKAYKLETQVYEEKYLYQCRDGVLARKRNLDAAKEHDAAAASRVEVAARAKRLRSTKTLCPPFPPVPAAQDWLKLFQKDGMRYPLLLVLGASFTGKTEWAKTLFRNPLELKVGSLEHFPEKMRSFARGVHDGLILDDIRDLKFLENHQEKLQGKYDALVEFASTPGGQLAYEKDLYAVPVVATVNYSTKNLELLETSDWLKLPGNRVLVKFPPAAPAAEG